MEEPSRIQLRPAGLAIGFARQFCGSVLGSRVHFWRFPAGNGFVSTKWNCVPGAP